AAEAVSRGEANLVRCYQWSDLGAFKFIVLEDLRGESLDERLARGNKLAPREACRIVRGAAVGLARLHAQGETHAEIRPANIWLSQNGTVKLLGYPLARDPLAGPKTLGDADDYLAPDMAQAGAKPDPRSDMYALGCVLYQLLAGQVPFAGGDARQKAARKSSETPTACDRINPAVPAALARVVGYMMHKNPDQRYQQATNVVEALAAYTGADTSPNGAAADAPGSQAFEAWLKQPSPPGQAARGQGVVGTANTAVVRAAQAPVAVAVQPPLVARPGAAWPAQAHSAQSHSVQPHPAQGGVALVQAPVAVQVPRAVAVQVPVASPTVSFDPVGTGQASLAARLAGPRRKKPVMTYVVLGGAGLVATAVIAFMVIHANSLDGQSSPSSQDSTASVDAKGADGSNAAANPSPEESAAEPVVEPAMEAITSIGELIWEPPTSGQPLDLAYLAPGAQVVVAVRPAALMKHAEWEKLADPRTLGTVSRWLTADLREQAGTPLENIELAIIGLIDASPAPPRVVMVLHTVEELVADDVAQAWGDARAEDVEGAAIRVQGERAFYLPAEAGGKVLVIAPPEVLREVVKSGDEPPRLRLEMEVLLAASDAERHFTLLAAPNFPFTGGKSLFTEQGAKLQGPLDGFLEVQEGEGKLELPKAAMLSVHLTEKSMFAELRVFNSFAGRPTGPVADIYRERIERLPKQVSNYVRDLYLSDYSKPVLWDFKDQLSMLDKFTRVGYDGKQIVLRAYLPAIAAHNLALGAHLALLENPGKAGPGAAPAVAANRLTVADKLKRKTTLAFPRNTLETALKLLSDDVGVEIEMMGKDFQEEGITKNQSFGFDQTDKPAFEILLAILKQADPAGRLVYVIKPKDGGGEDTIYITTRGAAAKRGDKLPPELETN
ncbi:MAG TPA: protein kinase, partial [Pirellulales bacterium]|nr:protein kinase [Pirellulales bacterium]